jgi:hypothetical protein
MDIREPSKWTRNYAGWTTFVGPHTTMSSTLRGRCTAARIALHAGAISHQREAAALAARRGFVPSLTAAFGFVRATAAAPALLEACASSLSVGESWCSGSAVFSAVAAAPRPRRAAGPEEVIAVKLVWTIVSVSATEGCDAHLRCR